MNKLAFGGLIPFLVMAPIYKSPAMFIVFIFGCLFHRYPKSRALYLLDTGTNASLLLYACCQDMPVRRVGLFVLTFYPMNSLVFPAPSEQKLWKIFAISYSFSGLVYTLFTNCENINLVTSISSYVTIRKNRTYIIYVPKFATIISYSLLRYVHLLWYQQNL